jgi:hypothetical protein
MATGEQFKLRAGTTVYATLEVHPNGGKTLHHSLSDFQVATCPGFAVYDSTGQLLTINVGAGNVSLNEPNGRRRLALQISGEDDTITDVTDPKGQVALVVKLIGPPSVGNEPVKNAALAFNLRWIASSV